MDNQKYFSPDSSTFETEPHPFSKPHSEINEPREMKTSQGDKAVSEGRFLEAALLYSEELRGYGCPSDCFYKRAKCLMEINNIDLALKDLKKAIDLKPNEIVYQYRLLDCYLRMGDSDKANELLSFVREKFPSYDKGLNFKVTQIDKLKKFKDHKFEFSIKDNEAYLKNLNSRWLNISPACPDYKFLKMRTLVILKRINEIDDNLNDSKMLDALVAYYNGDIEKCSQLISSAPTKKVQSVENFKSEVKSLQEIKNADTLAHNNDIGASLEIFKKLRSVDPSNRELNKVIVLRMARLYCEIENTAEASKLVSIALEIDEKCFIAASIQARCLLQNNKLEETLSKCDEILSVQVPSVVEEDVRQIRAKAVEVVERLKSLQPEFGTRKITKQNKTGDHTLRTNDAEPSERTRVKKYIHQAQLFITHQDFDQASEEAAKAVRVGLQFCISVPEAILCFLSLGMVKEVEALNTYQNDKNIAADLATLKNNNAMLERVKETKNGDLLKIVERSQTIAPACVDYRNLKINCLIKLGRYIDAEKMISQVMKIHPKHGEMIHYQCNSYYHQGEMSHLSDCLKEKIRNKQDVVETRKHLIHVTEIINKYERGTRMYQENNFSGAYKAFSEISKIYTVQSKYKRVLLYNIGSCCFNQRVFNDAIHFFDQSLSIDDTHLKSLAKRAEAYFLCDLFEDCIIDCDEHARICPTGQIAKLKAKAHSAKLKRGKLDIKKLLDLPEGSELTEDIFQKFLDMFDPKQNLYLKNLEKMHLDWKYQLLTTEYDQFKSNRNPENENSP